MPWICSSRPGIRFISVAHEQGAGHMADGYSRVSNRQGVCIAQNGPGITNFVTAVAAAYWAHSPVVVITPETGSSGIGLGGFQETEQLPIFSKITKFQAHVARQDRMAELTSRCFDLAMTERGPDPAQHPARHLLWRGRRHHPQADPRRARRRRGGEPGGGGQGPGGRQIPGHRGRRRRHHVRRPGRGGPPRRASLGPGGHQLSAQRCLPREPSADVRARWAIRAPRRR